MRSELTNTLVLSVAAVIVLGACPQGASGAQDAVRSSSRPLLPAATAWESRLPVLPAAPAAQDAERVYVPLEDGTLLALDRETGAQAWMVPSLGRSTPLVGDERIHVRTAGGLVTLDATSGRQLWKASIDGLPETTRSPGAVVPGRAVVLRTDRGLVALKVEDGTVLWESALPGEEGTDSVTPGRDVVYVTDATGVAAIGLDDGRLRWRREVPGATAGTPALLGDRLLVGTTDKALVALRATSGDLAWRWRLGGLFVGAAAHDDVIYVSALDALLRALRRGSGNEVWRLELDTRPTAPPVVRGGVVVQAGNDPVLAIVDLRTGMVVARHAEDGDLLGPPLIATDGESPEESADAVRRHVAIVLLFQDGRIVGLSPQAETESTAKVSATPADTR